MVRYTRHTRPLVSCRLCWTPDHLTELSELYRKPFDSVGLFGHTLLTHPFHRLPPQEHSELQEQHKSLREAHLQLSNEHSDLQQEMSTARQRIAELEVKEARLEELTVRGCDEQ